MKNLSSIIFFFVLLITSSVVVAVEESDVVVKGNVRIPVQFIISKLSDLILAETNKLNLDSIIKTLYLTQLFTKVEAFLEGQKLVIMVSESPVIENVIFDGNTAQLSKDLAQIVSSKPLSILKQDQLKQDITLLLDIYRKQGMFRAEVFTTVKILDGGKVDLIFNIKEGPKVKIKHVDFVNNKVFSDNTLRHVILSKTFSMINLMSEAHYYIPDRVEADKAALRDFYLKNGYIDFNTVHVSADLSGDDAYLSFILEEGPKYRVGKVKFENKDIESHVVDDLRKLSVVTVGSDFTIHTVNDDIKNMTNFLSERGYFFAQVEPSYQPEGSLVDITYRVSRGNKFYVNRINVLGNNRTKDAVVRKHLLVTEGDPLNPLKVNNSKQKLLSTGFFSDVDIEIVNLDSTHADLNIFVKEQSTGSLQFSTGFSSHLGLVGIVGLRERNFLGNGDELYFSVERSTIDFNGNLGVVKHNIGNSEVSLGCNFFKQSVQRMSESSYNSSSNGFSLWYDLPFNSNLSFGLHYTDTNTDIVVDPLASPIIQQISGKSRVSNLGYSLVYTDLNNMLFPSKGSYVKFTQDLAGLLGNINFIRSEFNGTYFRPVFPAVLDDVVYKGSIRVGNIFDYENSSLNIAYNFFLGLYDVRGFAHAGIGPRDVMTGDALGGKNYFVWSHQLNFPLTKGFEELDKLGVQGVLFVDAANLTGVDYNGPNIFDDSSLRVSAGFGLNWVTPFGPMGIDFGFPLSKGIHDRTQLIRFSLGKAF